MERNQVVDCLNSGNITPEFITDWAKDKVPEEKLSLLVETIMQYGILPPDMIPDMVKTYEVYEIFSRIGQHIMWY